MGACARLVNGSADAPLDAGDRGLAFGDGLFETMAVIDGSVRFLDRHIGRLMSGCKRLELPAPDAACISREAGMLAAGQHRAVLKLIVTRGSGGVGYAQAGHCEPTRIIERRAWHGRGASDYQNGIDLGVCKTRISRQPALAGLKHLNRLEQVLGRAEMSAIERSEGLMLDDKDNVIEATAANVFAVHGGDLLTPRLDNCGVRGVMRAVVLDTALSRGLRVRRCRLELPRLLDASEVFLTNALAGIVPVRSLGPSNWPPGPVTCELAGALEAESVPPCG